VCLLDAQRRDRQFGARAVGAHAVQEHGQVAAVERGGNVARAVHQRAERQLDEDRVGGRELGPQLT
jgi:hypothetical protein